MRSTKVISFFASFSILGLAACANVADEPSENPQPVETTVSELRALQDNEKLGTIAFGESRTTSYAENPLYRAYSFSGRVGDSVDIWVRSSTSTDALAFLLASDYTTLASNDNASSSTKDSHIVFTLPTTATYWIAFREANQESANFTVSLNGGGSNTPGDVFDPATCAGGTAFTEDYALRYFEPGANHSTDLASVRAYRRKRQCNKVTGCAAWQDNPSELVYTFDDKAINSGAFSASVASDSSVHLQFSRNDGSSTIVFYSTALGSNGSSTMSGYNYGYYLRDGAAINEQQPTLNLRVSTSCFHAKLTGSTIRSDRADYLESEFVLYGSTIAPPH